MKVSKDVLQKLGVKKNNSKGFKKGQSNALGKRKDHQKSKIYHYFTNFDPGMDVEVSQLDSGNVLENEVSAQNAADPQS